jgi:hypothetical protein
VARHKLSDSEHEQAASMARAMSHVDKPGAGFRKRKKLGSAAAKRRVVMKEFSRGTLHLPKKQGGGVVTNPKQAVAIAYSEGKRRARG